MPPVSLTTRITCFLCRFFVPFFCVIAREAALNPNLHRDEITNLRPAPHYSAYRTSILSRFFPSVNAVFWTISTFCCLLRVQDLDFVTFFVVAKTGPFFAKIALIIALFFVVFQTQNGSSGPPFLRGLRKDVPEKWGVATPFLAIFKINGKKGLF